jgi:ribosomal protein S18 acetylase RimI-like enzyme
MPTIRSATQAESGEVLTVLRAAFVTEAQLHDDVYMDPLTESLDDVRAVIGTGMLFVAVDGHRIVGTARGAERDGAWHISRVAVVPDRQGDGIGSALLRAVEAAAPARLAEFTISTGPKSVRNVALYERHGYVQTESPDILIRLTKKKRVT